MERDARSSGGNTHPGGGGGGGRRSGDMHPSGYRYNQLPLRFRGKKNRHFYHHKDSNEQREDANLNILQPNPAPQANPYLGPNTHSQTNGLSGGGRGVGGRGGGGGGMMFPGAMVGRIRPRKEPLLPNTPPPMLLSPRGGCAPGPIAFFPPHQLLLRQGPPPYGMGYLATGRTDRDHMPIVNTEPSKPAFSVVDMHKARIHSRSESASSVGSVGAASDPALKKVMKDLHRCEVSISRYQSMLNEHCDAGLRYLHQAFITLHIGLNARERDLARALQLTRHTAGTILHYRKSTATILHQLGERAGDLDDGQICELKKQIKQFMSDRKVDEEIGTTSRFVADPNDLLPHIMTFGKVVNQRHSYTSWEGNPAAAVERSKHTRSMCSISSDLSSPADEAVSYTSTSQDPYDSKMEDSVFGLPTHFSRDSIDEKDLRQKEQKLAEEDKNEDGREEGKEEGGELVEVGVEHLEEGTRNVDEEDDVEDGEMEKEKKIHEEKKELKTQQGDQQDDPTNTQHFEKEDIVQEKRPQADSAQHTAMNGFKVNEGLLTSQTNSSNSLQSLPFSSQSANSATEIIIIKPTSSSTATLGHKKPFSRKFASSPVVVTHSRRQFAKPLPRNLDPKSTVTLLLSNSMQQKYGKQRGQKSFQTGSAPSSMAQSRYHSEGAPGNSAPGGRELKLRGREKEKEFWRKKLQYHLSSEEQQRCLDGVEDGGKCKHSAEELTKIQSRVRESLRAQGVFLYDPVTGAIPAKEKEDEVLSPTLVKIDTTSDISSSSEHKKKTPTQLRRERKKRQKEREKRQKELGQKMQEDEDEKGSSRVPLREKATQSASTSGTISPLSSIDNSNSDSQRDLTSLSSSQSPLPQNDDGEHGKPGDMQRCAFNGTVQVNANAQEKEGLQERSNGVAVATNSESKIEESSLNGEKNETKREERVSELSQRASPTIEWDGCHQVSDQNSHLPNHSREMLRKSSNSCMKGMSKVISLQHCESTTKHQENSTAHSANNIDGLTRCNTDKNIGQLHAKIMTPASKPLERTASLVNGWKHSERHKSRFAHSLNKPSQNHYPPSSFSCVQSNDFPFQGLLQTPSNMNTNLSSDGHSTKQFTGPVECLPSKLKSSIDSDQNLIINGHEE